MTIHAQPLIPGVGPFVGDAPEDRPPLTSRSLTIPGGKSGGRLCSRSGR